MQKYKIKAKLQKDALYLVFFRMLFRFSRFDNPLFFPNFARVSILLHYIVYEKAVCDCVYSMDVLILDTRTNF